MMLGLLAGFSAALSPIGNVQMMIATKITIKPNERCTLLKPTGFKDLVKNIVYVIGCILKLCFNIKFDFAIFEIGFV